MGICEALCDIANTFDLMKDCVIIYSISVILFPPLYLSYRKLQENEDSMSSRLEEADHQNQIHQTG